MRFVCYFTISNSGMFLSLPDSSRYSATPYSTAPSLSINYESTELALAPTVRNSTRMAICSKQQRNAIATATTRPDPTVGNCKDTLALSLREKPLFSPTQTALETKGSCQIADAPFHERWIFIETRYFFTSRDKLYSAVERRSVRCQIPADWNLTTYQNNLI